MNPPPFYVVIVGSGPAGLGVAQVLKTDSILSSKTLILEKGRSLDERICMVKEGKKCRACEPCNILSGVGGAGPYTDGKICLYPQDLKDLLETEKTHAQENGAEKESSEKIDKYLDTVKKLWLESGVTDLKEIEAGSRMETLKAGALKQGINYTCYPVLHIGSDGAREAISKYVKSLTDAGIKIEPNCNVVEIKKVKEGFEVTYEKTGNPELTKSRVFSDFLVLALGREMQKPTHLKKLLGSLNLSFKPRNLEIGVRVEVPHQIMDEIIEITFDPKFTMITPTYQDFVRTFCTCHRGRVVREGLHINGHVDRTKPTENTNFALLVRWPLDTLILEDAMDFGNTIAKLALSQGNGKPLIQRLVDLKNRVSSTEESINKSYIKPTLRRDWHVTPGDISSCYPTRIIVDILEGLEMLDKVIKGINNDQNLLYAPEIKPTCSVKLKEGVKTEIPRLYVCGDFSGYTRGIAQAMAMGMMIGEDIIAEKKKGLQSKIIEHL